MPKDFKHLKIAESKTDLINAVTGIGNWRLIDMHPQEVIVFMNFLTGVPIVEEYNDKWSHATYYDERVVVIFTRDAKGQPDYGIAVWIPLKRLPVSLADIRTRDDSMITQWKPKTEG